MANETSKVIKLQPGTKLTKDLVTSLIGDTVPATDMGEPDCEEAIQVVFEIED